MLANDIATRLSAVALGTLGTDLFDVPFPHDAPDVATCVVDRPGSYEGTFGASLSAAAFEEGEFQVITRGSREAVTASRAAIEAVKTALHRLGPIALGGKTYYDIRTSTPYFLRYDEEGRPMWAITGTTEKEA